MSTKLSFPWMLVRNNDEEIHVRVTGTYYAGRPEVRNLSNGDPGYPAEPPDFAYTVKDENGVEYELTEAEEELLLQEADDEYYDQSSYDGPDYDESDAKYDGRYDSED